MVDANGMTKSVVSVENDVQAIAREPRPFLFLEPARLPLRPIAIDPLGLERLDAEVGEAVPALARSVVNYSIALQNRSALERGNRQPIQLSVLNRRRRAARAWLNAVLAGQTDAATLHAVGTQWLPVLCGSGPDARPAPAVARRFVEFVRGAITAHLFSEPCENLLPHARALHVLETVLAMHLAGAVTAARATATR